MPATIERAVVGGGGDETVVMGNAAEKKARLGRS